jgi:hypothetical protein
VIEWHEKMLREEFMETGTASNSLAWQGKDVRAGSPDATAYNCTAQVQDNKQKLTAQS